MRSFRRRHRIDGMKIFSIFLVFFGELLAVYAETFIIKYKLFSGNFWKLFLLITIGGFLLLVGYYLGYKAYQNLWVITVISIVTLLITEPLILVVFLNQTPTVGMLTGFALGIIGLFLALFY